MTDSSGEGTAQINPFRYRGYYQDEETGWYYLQSRYYYAEVHRFLNADDVDYLGSENLECNLMTYCENNSVKYSDYDGNSIHLGKHWYNYKTFLVAAITVIIMAIGFSLPGLISNGVVKGTKKMSAFTVKKLSYKAKNKLQRIIYGIAIRCGRDSLRKGATIILERGISILFVLIGFSVEGAIFEAIDRADGNNDDYWFA